MQTSRVLFVVTSADMMGNAPDPTGSWIEEVAAPYYAFTDAKYDVTIASPLGGQAPLDPTSLREENATASTRRFEADVKAQAALAHTIKLSTVEFASYDAIFFPGGHGTMEDFPKDATVKAAVEYFYQSGKPLSSVCHGPACLVEAVKPTGEPVIKGHSFTCFTDEEETTVGLDKLVPFLLESRLSSQGGKVRREKPFQPNVVVDKNLITGQNPASSIPAAEAVIHRLRARQQLSDAA